MAVVREHLVVGGEIIEQTGMGGDDDGAPPMVPGMRIHKDGEIDAMPSSTPDLSEIEAIAARIKSTKGKVAKVKPASRTKVVHDYDGVSDRRRCLELAVASGETDPDEVLAIAGRYLGFLIEGEPA